MVAFETMHRVGQQMKEFDHLFALKLYMSTTYD